MKLADMKTLNQLTQAKYLARQQIFKKLLQREHAIRRELQRLDEQGRLSDKKASRGMKTIGADVIWKAWLGKTKTQLNMQLALILAEKEQHIRQVRQAYGKVLATEDLVEMLTEIQDKKRQKKMLEQAVEMSLFPHTNSR
ncbi:hypothetical protein [uncultured Roseobacter sp.]|uniref:hypothetical protein n=1 Tax=uncultured Roseobacter sp. TaxID=114847 RepID=UPI0026208267|nr:hypothetical protein [uncultured Roseobacter sp.]